MVAGIQLSPNNYLNSRVDYSTYLTETEGTLYTTPTEEVGDNFVSESKEKCTDGKDDGKIGLFSAIGNAVKGVGKTIVGGIKGMFTNKEGKFSLGKTLLSVGTAAACVAFPAVGLALCGVGAVAGGVQVAKGISKAATAKTDAEAKEAWQNIGGGAFTVATSVAGAKASYNAVQSSAAASAKGSALQALKSKNPNAGMLSKTVALGKDCLRSTTNNAKNIVQTTTALRQNSIKGKMDKLEGAHETFAEAGENVRFAQDKLMAAEENGITSEIEAAKKALESARNEFETAKSPSLKLSRLENKQARLANKEVSAQARANADAITNKVNSAKTKVSTKLKNVADTTPRQVVDKAKSAVSNVVDKARNNTSKLSTSFKNAKENGFVKTAGDKLTGQLKETWKFLTEDGGSVEAAVNQFGYDTVLQTLAGAGIPTTELYNSEIA